MLQNLHVKNLALIDESEVDFAGGLNILSGETGAGKSIIIGSINLALGGKVQKEMLRNPEKPALVELIFSVTEKQKQVLKQLDVETEDDEVILSRRITGGRGVSKVNGESVPASKVKEIASVLIDIHGQHEHQSLLSKKKHLEILDSYAKEEIEQPKKELAEAYKDYKKLVSELNDADVDEEERLREVSFLEYEVGEIEEAGLTVGEDEVTGNISLDEDKYLVLSIPYQKGWTAYVDGEETELLRANYMYMALPLSAGEHSIRLTFAIPGVRYAMIIMPSAAGVFVLLLLVRWLRRKRRVKDCAAGNEE